MALPSVSDVNPLLGTWSLVGFHTLIDGDVVGSPLGESPLGQLTYQAKRRMSAVLMRRNRKWSPEASFLTEADDVRGQAAAGFSAYAGTYSIEDDVVYHDVEVSLFPERVGTRLVRKIAWSDGNLVLNTPVVTTRSGRSRWDRLEWRAVAG